MISLKKVMIDMDDVICDGGFLEVVNMFLGTSYKIEEIKDYYIQNLIPKEKNKEWIEFFDNNNFYNYAKLLPNAYEVIEKLNEKYEVYIGSAYVFVDEEKISGKLLQNKFEYLYKNLPFIKPEQYIFINNKELLNCEIKIDDKLSNLSGNAEVKLLFSAYHNKNISEEELKNKNVTRVNDWKDIENLLIND